MYLQSQFKDPSQVCDRDQEAEWIAAAQEGDMEAFGKIWDQHSKRLHRTLSKYTPEEADREDILHDAAISAMRFIHKFEPGTNIGAWLTTITVNLSKNHYRKYRDPDGKLGSQIREGSFSLPEQWNNVIDHMHHRTYKGSKPTTYDTMEQELLQEIEKASETMKPQFKEVMELCMIEGYQYNEAAERLGCPIGTVMSRLNRARGHLKKELKHHL